MALSARVKARISLCLMVFSIAALVGAGIAVIYLQDKGSNLKPSPGKSEQVLEDDGFPKVDWKKWKKINPDIIGWITVPGTEIDYPIVQAPQDDPQFYLSHDVYKDWNYVGCPYLSHDCRDGGLFNSLNAVVYGHNMGWNQEMFGPLANMSDSEYAHIHTQIYVQTPKAKRVFTVQAVDVIPGWDAVNRTVFDDKADAFSWWEERYDASDVKLGNSMAYSSSMLTLCTCSYNYWLTERTIVYCI